MRIYGGGQICNDLELNGGGVCLFEFGSTLAYKVIYNQLAVMPHLSLGVTPGTSTPATTTNSELVLKEKKKSYL